MVNHVLLPNPQSYYQQVWELARQIPHGKVATYGQLGQMLEPPEGIEAQDYKSYCPRWVGDAMAACPQDVPWQRVINSQGKISQRPGAEKQKQLLEAEGQVFLKDKLDLAHCQWGKPDEDAPVQASLF